MVLDLRNKWSNQVCAKRCWAIRRRLLAVATWGLVSSNWFLTSTQCCTTVPTSVQSCAGSGAHAKFPSLMVLVAMLAASKLACKHMCEFGVFVYFGKGTFLRLWPSLAAPFVLYF